MILMSEKMKKQGKVLVAMSGGVDSSVAALLLQKQGYDVTGATLQIWSDDVNQQSAGDNGCCSLSAVDDARRVAEVLGIPYYVFNFKDIFTKTVIEPFIKEYQTGRTPNPCIFCNWHVKFEEMLKKALEMGFDYLATGHYAGIDQKNGKFRLLAELKNRKDQTYALYRLNQMQLSHLLLPVAGIEKPELRKIAEDAKLPVAKKKDSQEICFVTDNDYAGFIREYTGEEQEKGDFVDKDGKSLGKHRGIIHYTVGQRKGIGIASENPYYVLSIDAAENKVVLGEDKDLFTNALEAGEIHWISGECPKFPYKAQAKIRYLAPPVNVVIKSIPETDEKRIRVEFEDAVRAVTPGQSVVFYQGSEVLGGGLIL